MVRVFSEWPLRDEPPPHDLQHDREYVARPYLLSFQIGAAEVGNRYLVDLGGARHEAGEHLGVLLPAERLQLTTIEQRSPVEEIAGIDVAECRIEGQVEQQGNE